MSSSTKNQNIDGYIEEYSKAHNKQPVEVVETKMAREFFEYADNRDTDIYKRERERKNDYN